MLKSERNDIMSRAEKAVELKRRNNCCQAVLLAFADKLPPLDENILRQIGSGFGSGMGCMEGTCGALCGACMVAGMLNNTGRPTAMLSRMILNDFQEKCGATICKDLNGISTGKVLCSCDDCVKNAVLALESVIGT